MTGLNMTTGQPLGGLDHLRQSIARILVTPIGTRVMRRDFGSLLFDLIDQPFTPATKVRLFAAIAVALQRWEPRLRLRKIGVERGAAAGQFVITLEGSRSDGPKPGAYERLTLPLRTDANRVLSLAA